MSRRARADAATIDRRVDHITTLILNGESTSKILRNPSVRRWKLTPRQVETYIAKARDQIRTLSDPDKVTQYGLAVARLERIYAAAFNAGDWSSARGAVKDLLQLYGIAGPIHVKVEGTLTVTTFAEAARAAADHLATQVDAGGTIGA